MKKYDVIGLMSGTSLDGLDMVFVRFSHDINWSFEIIEYDSLQYDTELYSKLKRAHDLNGLELKTLDINFGKWIGQRVQEFINSKDMVPELIVSHGHTIFHQPDSGLTLQIGDGYQIMLQTGIKTVCDLRSLDIALGGQGAPLVPLGDKLLFPDYDLCLNLGGFSNISFDIKGDRIAYDICPVNTVLNELASRMGLTFDHGGEIARRGNVNVKLLQTLNSLSYYSKPPPKSLGVEWAYEYIFPLLHHDTLENLLNTFNHHIAGQIAHSIEVNYALSKTIMTKMLVTGGGAKNDYLLDLLRKKTKNKLKIIVPDNPLIDFKEAIIFAFLGLLRVKGKINTLKTVTGAKMDSSGGLIYNGLMIEN